MMRSAFRAVFAMLVASSAPASAQVASHDDPIATPGGNSVDPIPGWRSSVADRVLRFEAPEGDLSLAIVDVGRSGDARSAASTAWSLFRPDDRHRQTAADPRPARRGWDERVDFDYDAAPGEEVHATALRHGEVWTVLIVDGSKTTARKQEDGIFLARTTLHPAGYVRESFAGHSAHRLDAARIAAMRSFVETSIRELGIPGASFALIDHGKVVYEGGIGVKQLGGDDPVDARTLFQIASNTKSMTTLLLAELVDRGRIAWNEPVTKAYPPFRLNDAALTASMRMRDLVCACTGLPRRDLEWEFNTPAGTKADITFNQLSVLTPTTKPGATFQYNNQLPSAAGYIAGHVLYPEMEEGAAYDRAMQTFVFDPLKMKDTTFSFDRALEGNVALPHSDDVDGHPQVQDIAFDRVIIPYRPAGGAWSSVHDLINYVGLELSGGLLPNGKRLVSRENLLARRERRVSTGENGWYGMGLWEDTKSDVSVFYHGGNMPGYFSDFDIIPSAKVGAVILTNAGNGNLLVRSFRRRLLELLYDGKPEAAEDVAVAARDLRASIAKDRARLAVPADPDITSRLAARYYNPVLGPLDVRTDASGTSIVATSMSSQVATMRNDDGTASLVPIDPGSHTLNFVIGARDGRRTLTTRTGDQVYVFEAR